MIEQQVDEELIAAHVQPVLAAHECKTGAELYQEAGDVLGQRLFEVAFLRVVGQAEEIEDIGILERFARHIRLRRRETVAKVGDGITLPFMQPRFDLHSERVSRPTVFDGFRGIPFAFGIELQFVE